MTSLSPEMLLTMLCFFVVSHDHSNQTAPVPVACVKLNECIKREKEPVYKNVPNIKTILVAEF